MVMGGMLYFFLYREAKFLGLIQNDVNREILRKFLTFKTIDIDVQGEIQNLKYTDRKNSFLADSVKFTENYKNLSKKVYQDHKKCFDFLRNLLQPKLSVNYEGDFGFLTEISVDDNLEYRPKICVKIGEHDDHIFEALLLVNFETHKKKYNLKCFDKPFFGENIIRSITQQIYPMERGWLTVDTKKLSAREIYQKMKELFENDKMHRLKFKQGYYRVYMVSYILEKAYENNVDHLLKIILPTNNTLRLKMHYFRSSLMNKLLPKDLIKEAVDLINGVRIKPMDQIASPEDTLRFIKLCLSAWKHFNKQITKRWYLF
jgi:hypothetical protein